MRWGVSPWVRVIVCHKQNFWKFLPENPPPERSLTVALCLNDALGTRRGDIKAWQVHMCKYHL